MAQRARKILQEEGSHHMHAEAWARRLCRAGAGERDALVAALRRRGSTPAAGRARPTTPAAARPSREGMIRRDAAHSASTCAPGWPTLLGAEGVAIALDEPSDWSRWDPERGVEP